MFSVLILLCITFFSGVAFDEAFDEAKAGIDKNSFELAGFVDMRIGVRTQNDPLQKNDSINELRLQLEAEKEISDLALNVVFDLLLDPVADSYVPDYDTGEGVIDPRRFNMTGLRMMNWPCDCIAVFLMFLFSQFKDACNVYTAIRYEF